MLYNMINNTYESFSKEREMDFNGKVAVITGASSGIGLAIMKKFWEQGARTVNLDLADEVFGSDLFFKGDISDPEFLKECCEKTVEHFGKIDYLINNVGDFSKRGLLSGCSYEDFMYIQKIGLAAPYTLTKLFMEHFNEEGAIVNIASTRAFMSQPDSESYAASKGGIVAMTHAMAASLQGKIRVNCISPGWIDNLGSDLSEADKNQHFVKRVGCGDDIANAVLFLCSNESSFITGQNITVDGGMTKNMIYHGDLGWNLETK